MNPKKSKTKPQLEITPIGDSKLPWLNNRESEAFLVLAQKETCRVRRTTRHTFFLSHPEIRMDARSANQTKEENIPAAELRLEGAGTLTDAVAMAEAILEPVLRHDARMLVVNAPWAESTSLKDVEKPTPAQMKFLLIKNELAPEDIPFLTRKEASIRITTIHSLEAARLASQQMPVGIYKGVAFDLLHVYNPRYLEHTLASGAAKGWGAEDAIQTAVRKNPLDWVKNHRRKLFAAHLAGQEADLREKWEAGDQNGVRNAIETALAADTESPWPAIQTAAELATQEKSRIDREAMIKAVETPAPAKAPGKLRMISEKNAHLFERTDRASAGKPAAPKSLKMNARDFKTVIQQDPSWAKSLTHDVEIIGECNMDGSPITHLSDKLTFRGEPERPSAHPIQFAPHNRAASFRNCPNLKCAEGTFHGRVTFEGSGIETIGNLKVVSEPNSEKYCVSFRNCKQLESARGEFSTTVDFSHSGIRKIDRDLVIHQGCRGNYNNFEGCHNLVVAEGNLPGGANFNESGIASIAYLNTKMGDFWGPASFLGCKNLRRENIPTFFQNGNRYKFDPETVNRQEPKKVPADAYEPWPF